MLFGLSQTVKERFANIKAVVRLRQIHAQKMCLLLDAADRHQRLAEIHLGVSWRMRQRHKHFLVPQARLPNVILYDRVTATEAVLFLEPIPDPLGRVPLFLRLRLVVLQNLVDDAQPRPQLGRSTGFFLS